MKNDETDFLKKIRQPTKYHTSEDEEYYIIDMVRMSYSQVVKIMLKLRADHRITSKKRVYYENNEFDEPDTSLF